MTTPLLEARSIRKSFQLGKTEIQVLKGVDLSIERGETVALLGTSGAGKSTLLHLLGLLDRPSDGSIHFDDRRVDDLPTKERARLRHRRIGFVFQFYHLIPELDAFRNVQLGALMDVGVLRWMGQRRQIRNRANALLEEVGLSERSRHRPAELSGGERQRVAIARALIAEPELILADEPTGNLDSETAADILDLLFRINRERGIAFLLVTHDPGLAARCDRIIRMRDGRIEGQTVAGEAPSTDPDHAGTADSAAPTT